MNSTEKSSNVYLIMAVALLTVSAVFNVVLTQNVIHARKIARPETKVAIEVGTILHGLELVRLDGQEQFTEIKPRQLVFIFTTTCQYCRRNLQNWRSIEEQKDNFPALYVSLDDVQSTMVYVKKNNLPPSKVFVLASAGRAKLKSFAVPQTFLLEGQKVTKAIVGLLTNEQIAGF